MPQVDIKLVSTADASGIIQTQGALSSLERGIGRASSEWDQLGRKLERKFSLPDIGYDILRMFGLGGGGAIVERVITGFFRASEERARAAAEEAKRFTESLDKLIVSSDRLAETKIGNWIESLAPSDKIAEKRKEIAALTAQIAEEQKKYSAAYNAIAEKSTFGGKLVSALTGSPEKGEYNIIGSQAAWAAHQAFIKKNLDAQIASQTRLVELQSRLEELTKSISTEQKKISDEEAKEAAEANKLAIEAAQEEERARERAAESAKKILEDRLKESAAIKAQASDQEKLRQEIEKINALRGVRNGLSDAEADAAISRLYDSRRKEAEAIQQQTSEQARYNAEVAKINALRGGTGGLSDAEANAAIARLDAERQINREKENSRKLADQIATIDASAAVVENNHGLTQLEKNEQLLPLLEQQNVLLNERLTLLQREAAATGDDKLRVALESEIASLRKQLSANAGKETGIKTTETRAGADQRSLRELSDPTQHYQSPEAGVSGGFIGFIQQAGTMADQLASGIRNTLGTAVSSITNEIMKWDGTGRGALRAIGNIGMQVFQAMVQQLVQMAVQWGITQLLIKTGLVSTHALGETLKAEEAASTVATEGAKTPILATNAGLASVSSFGVAAILGIALLVAGIAALAFEDGGVIPGGKQLIWANEAGTESVLNARATALLGHDAVNALNAGNVYHPSIASALPRPYAPPVGRNGGNGYTSREHLSVNFVDGRDTSALEQLKRDPAHEAYIVHLVDKHRRRWGAKV